MNGTARSTKYSLFALLLACTAVTGGLLVTLPAKLLPFCIGACILLGVAAFSLLQPIVLLYFVILTSAMAGLFRRFESLDIGVTGLSVSGFRWVVVAGIGLLVIGFNVQRIQIPRHLSPFLVFVLWVIVCEAVSFDAVGLKDLLFYGLPPLMGIYALFVLSLHQRVAGERIEKALLFSVYIPVALYAVFIPSGLVELTSDGPVGVLEPRPVALYLAVVLALSLAQWRYATRKTARLQGAMSSLLALGTILFTLSRIASLVALSLLAALIVNPVKPNKSLLVIFVTLAVAPLVIYQIPAFRDRSFHQPDADLAELGNSFNSEGRLDYMWPTAFQHALESPLVGWGPGSTRVLLTSRSSSRKHDYEQYHPHNEYLQVFHDMGIIGVALLLLAWCSLLRKHWQGWRQAHCCGNALQAKWNMAATLGIVAVLISSVTDNTLHYAFVLIPLFIIVAAAMWVNGISIAWVRVLPAEQGIKRAPPRQAELNTKWQRA